VVLYAWGRIRGAEGSRGVAVFLYLFSVLSAVLAMKTKEIAFTLPLAVLLYEWVFFKASWRKRVVVLLPVLLTLIIIPLSVMGTDRPLGEVRGAVRPEREITDTDGYTAVGVSFDADAGDHHVCEASCDACKAEP
jgi:hypothetical protein